MALYAAGNEALRIGNPAYLLCRCTVSAKEQQHQVRSSSSS